MSAGSVSDDRVRDILADHGVFDGLRVSIGVELDRDEYLAVKRVLGNLGGRWDARTSVRAFVFEDDPTEALAAYIAGGPCPRTIRFTEGYVATPPELAAWIVREHTDIGDIDEPQMVLEPSAGEGTLVRAILDAGRRVHVVAIEPDLGRGQRLLAATTPHDDVAVLSTTFEAYAADRPARFDHVVMNPPFAMPGQPTLWIDHIRLAWAMLKPGGRLVSVAPNGYTFRDDRDHQAIRALISSAGGNHMALPERAFHRGGSDVRTVLIWADKPEAQA